MTVPVSVASDNSLSNQGLLMPKLKYRFRVIFENLGVSTPTTELTKQVMDFTRPQVSFEAIDIPIYNSTIKLAGKYSWGDVTCNLRDDAGGRVSQLIGEQLQKQLDFFEMASAASGIDYKFKTKFEVLDGASGVSDANVLETWELYGCYLSEVNYGDMNYGESAPATVALTIRFDNAAQTTNLGGVGTIPYAGSRTPNGPTTTVGNAE
jgi:hypothetical protein